MNILQPLYQKRDELTGELATVTRTLEDCAKIIANWELDDCPHCKQANNVELIDVPATIYAPQAHGIAIQCSGCGIQTNPEYWHLTEYDPSIYEALHEVFRKWGYSRNETGQQS